MEPSNQDKIKLEYDAPEGFRSEYANSVRIEFVPGGDFCLSFMCVSPIDKRLLSAIILSAPLLEKISKGIQEKLEMYRKMMSEHEQFTNSQRGNSKLQ